MVDGLALMKDGDVAELVIDRPEKRNALTDAMWAAVPDILASVESDRGAKVLVIRGAGDRAFSAGADIDEYRARIGNAEWGRRSRESVDAAIRAVRNMSKPTIAAIGGTCVGGGVSLALAADIRLAEPAAIFRIPPARLGLVYPFSDTRTLVQLVGPAWAKRLLFTAYTLHADEALRIGFIDELSSTAEGLVARARGLAVEIAELSQFSIRASKRYIRLILDGLTAESDETWELSGSALTGEDHAEGVTAFLEKRSPRFTYR